MPPGRDAFAARRIIVAWDGSAQAARAANDALPFLRAAEAIEVVSVCDDAEIHEAVPGAEFAPHLARHGVNVVVNDLPKGDGIAETLRSQAGLFRADLVVMGAYRHSPKREFSWAASPARSCGTSRAAVPVPLNLGGRRCASDQQPSGTTTGPTRKREPPPRGAPARPKPRRRCRRCAPNPSRRAAGAGAERARLGQPVDREERRALEAGWGFVE